MTRFRTFAVSLMLLAGVAPVRAQHVRLRGHGEADLDQLIRAALETTTLIITRDTTISASDTIPSSVLVLKSRFVLDGTVLGDVLGVEANLYLRPHSIVKGSVTNVSGGLYPSQLAKTGGMDDRSLAPYRVSVSGDDVVIQGLVRRPALKPMGGSLFPEYNRVDGLRVELGPSILLPSAFGVEPVLSGSIGYATEREEVVGRVQMLLKHGRSTLTAGWEDDATLTNEEWIRSALKNSLSFFWNGKDLRDYYEADRVYLEFHRVIERGDRASQYWVRGQNELAHPLAAGDPFVLFEPDEIRPNDTVPETRITSAFVGARTTWTGFTSAWDVSGTLEFAAKVLRADRAFNAYQAKVVYAMQALANHTLQIQANFRGPLPGTEDLPRQRWSFVGGSGTLYTFPIARFRGDRLAFVESEYKIPFRRELRMPVLGRPTLRLMHNIGMAWSREDARSFEQNVGVRLQFPLAFARIVTNPQHFGDDAEFAVGLSAPAKRYPWEKARRSRR